MKTRARKDTPSPPPPSYLNSSSSSGLGGIAGYVVDSPMVRRLSHKASPSPPPIINNNGTVVNLNKSVLFENSPIRRKKAESEETRKNEERMDLIAKALSNYTGDIEPLFKEPVWVDLIRAVKKGTPDERRWSSEAKLKRVAKLVIDQMVSKEYADKVSNILVSASGKIHQRGGRGSLGSCGQGRGAKFLVLASEYEEKEMWKQRENSSTSSPSSRSSDSDDTNENRCPPDHQGSRRPVLNSSFNIELEVEGGGGGDGKENSSTKRQTRRSGKITATQTQSTLPLRLQSSTSSSHHLGSHPRGKSESKKSRHALANNRIHQESPYVPQHQRTENSDCGRVVMETSTLDSKSSPFHLIEVKQANEEEEEEEDDEFIENETPPQTPLDPLEGDLCSEVPKKRTRLNSSMIHEDFDRSSSVSRLRVSPRLVAAEDNLNLNLPRLTRGTRFGSGNDSSDELSLPGGSALGANIIKDFCNPDDLPSFELPDTGRDKENLPKSEQEILRDYPKPSTGPPLRPYMFEEIENALSRPRKEKIVSGFGLTLKQEELAVYNKSEWLEDANIDLYLEMIKERNNKLTSRYPKVYIFRSYFYKLLDKRGYESVQGTTEKDNIFEYDIVLIPIHCDHHWLLVAVKFSDKTLTCYDSMDHDNERHLRTIVSYLKNEWRQTRNRKSFTTGRNSANFDPNLIDDDLTTDFLGEGWIIESLGAAHDIPQQKNGRDCGIFCLQYAEYISRGQEFDFEQRHTPYFRKRMLYETLKKCLLVS